MTMITANISQTRKKNNASKPYYKAGMRPEVLSMQPPQHPLRVAETYTLLLLKLKHQGSPQDFFKEHIFSCRVPHSCALNV